MLSVFLLFSPDHNDFASVGLTGGKDDYDGVYERFMHVRHV